MPYKAIAFTPFYKFIIFRITFTDVKNKEKESGGGEK